MSSQKHINKLKIRPRNLVRLSRTCIVSWRALFTKHAKKYSNSTFQHSEVARVGVWASHLSLYRLESISREDRMNEKNKKFFTKRSSTISDFTFLSLACLLSCLLSRSSTQNIEKENTKKSARIVQFFFLPSRRVHIFVTSIVFTSRLWKFSNLFSCRFFADEDIHHLLARLEQKKTWTMRRIEKFSYP